MNLKEKAAASKESPRKARHAQHAVRARDTAEARAFKHWEQDKRFNIPEDVKAKALLLNDKKPLFRWLARCCFGDGFLAGVAWQHREEWKCLKCGSYRHGTATCPKAKKQGAKG